ncbi:hypothetical protein MRB53_037349 [Persea americana]|nr:hypothetical protein MRB53_037349 [Persea americana]
MASEDLQGLHFESSLDDKTAAADRSALAPLTSAETQTLGAARRKRSAKARLRNQMRSGTRKADYPRDDTGSTQDDTDTLLNKQQQAESGDGVADDARSEIHSILEQFEDGAPQSPMEEALSPVQSGTKRGSVSYAASTTSQPPLPDPDPEPDLPFDFHRFLEQLKHKSADSVAKFLRSFLNEFGKKQWMVQRATEDHRRLSDVHCKSNGPMRDLLARDYNCLASIWVQGATERRACPPGSRSQRGSIKRTSSATRCSRKRCGSTPGVREPHLDIQDLGEKGRKFLLLAQQELIKIKSYRAPRDKVICVLNCCKVIFGYLKNSKSDQGADAFIPLLIYTVLKANPDHLVSNVQYILRFRNPEKLNGEAGYYMSSLLGAVQFIETLDRTNLTVSDKEFEQNVEVAVSAIAERPGKDVEHRMSRMSEKSGSSRPETSTRNTSEIPRPSRLPRDGNASGDEGSESDAVAGLLRTIQKPLSSIGRIFSDDSQPARQVPDKPAATPLPGTTPRMSPLPRATSEAQTSTPLGLPPGAVAEEQRRRLEAEDAAARQASAETEQAHRLQRAEHNTVVE